MSIQEFLNDGTWILILGPAILIRIIGYIKNYRNKNRKRLHQIGDTTFWR